METGTLTADLFPNRGSDEINDFLKASVSVSERMRLPRIFLAS